jgi:hypothetical protein
MDAADGLDPCDLAYATRDVVRAEIILAIVPSGNAALQCVVKHCAQCAVQWS